MAYSSSKDAARKLRLKSGSISACLNRKQTQTGGYEFVRDEEATQPDLLPGEEWRDVVAEIQQSTPQNLNHIN